MTDQSTIMPPGADPTPFCLSTSFSPVEDAFHLVLDALDDFAFCARPRTAEPVLGSQTLGDALARVLSEAPRRPTDHALLAAAGAVDLARTHGFASRAIGSLLPVLGFCRVTGTRPAERRTAMLLQRVCTLLTSVADRPERCGSTCEIPERVHVLDVASA